MCVCFISISHLQNRPNASGGGGREKKVAKLVTCETVELRFDSRVAVLCSLSFESKMWTSFGSSKERSLRRIVGIVLLSWHWSLMLCYPDARCRVLVSDWWMSRVHVLCGSFYVCPCSRRLFYCVSESSWGGGGGVLSGKFLPNVLPKFGGGAFF